MKAKVAYKKISKILKDYDSTSDANALRKMRGELSRTVLKLHKVYKKLSLEVTLAELEYKNAYDEEVDRLKDAKRKGENDYTDLDIKTKASIKCKELNKTAMLAKVELYHFNYIKDKASGIDNSISSDFKYTMKDLIT